MPRELGSTTPSTAAVATAASMALPPASRILTPASVASGWLEATIPFLAKLLNLAGMEVPHDQSGVLEYGSIGVSDLNSIPPLLHHSSTPPGKLSRFQNLRVKL